MKWPAIIDPDDDAATVRKVGDAGVRRQRQRRVGGTHRVHVVRLACRRFLVVEPAPVPRREPALLVWPEAGRRYIVAAEHRVRAVGETAERLESRDRVGETVEVRGRILA